MRIISIEGMRAFFAFWVLIGHVIGNSGFAKSDLWIGFKLLNTGIYAVDLFIIISGFVIFLLLDIKKENYFKYITRRFFRLFPAFIVIFILSIPISLLVPQNSVSYSHIFLNKPFPHLSYISTWWDNIELHFFAHLFMLHGLVPEVIAPGAPIAFLGPAWSISLEWQFYLTAPFFFFFANRYLVEKKNYVKVIILLTTIFAIAFSAMHIYPEVLRGAFLPCKIHLFMIGWASYYLSKYLSLKKADRDLVFLVCFLFSMVIGLTTEVYEKGGSIFPLLIWFVLFPFVVTSDKGWLTNKFEVVFSNKILCYLGKISYSIYLTHRILIILIMKLLAPFAITLNSFKLFFILFPTTVISTIIFSAFLYKFIEVPGMKLGSKISNRFLNYSYLNSKNTNC